MQLTGCRLGRVELDKFAMIICGYTCKLGHIIGKGSQISKSNCLLCSNFFFSHNDCAN